MQAQHIGCPVTPVYQSLDSFRGHVRHNLASRHQFPSQGSLAVSI
jgi:hypothetical protein